MHTIVEPSKTLDIARNVDVVVAGGGIAGVAAALSAARSGAKTLLVEKECALGGLATLGLVVMYLPLCDGYGHQVIGGISEELLRESLRYGNLSTHAPWQRIPACWDGEGSLEERARTRFRVDYDAAPMMLTLGELVHDAGVEIWYDTRLCSALVQKNTLTHVIVENKSGRMALAAKAFVDATGDADLCFLADENTASWNENRRSGWYFSASEDQSPQLHPLTDPLNGPCPPDSRFYAGDRGSEVSAYVQAMHAMILRHARESQGSLPFLIPTLPLFRMTRRMQGQETLTQKDLGLWREDAVAMTGDWRRPAPPYTIGLAHLMGHTRNLLSAGRCISASGDAWDVTRVIPTCGATGQAAGAAASMLADRGEIDLPLLQKRLRQAGMILDSSLAGGKR